MTAAVTRRRGAESGPVEHIALPINRYISMLLDGDDSSERESPVSGQKVSALRIL